MTKKQKKIKNFWDYELTSFSCVDEMTREKVLHLDIESSLATSIKTIYIKIRSYQVYSVLDSCMNIFYKFYIYRNGMENVNGYLSNEIGYSNYSDCIKEVKKYINNNWNIITASYSEDIDKLIENSSISRKEFDDYMNNKSSFIPDLYSFNNCNSKKFVDYKEVTFKL